MVLVAALDHRLESVKTRPAVGHQTFCENPFFST
jgi:hypothetical protein